MKKTEFSQEIGRSWLHADYDEKRISFAYPPVKGTHVENYKVINADPEIVPAEGFELSLLVQGAFLGNSKQWQDVRDRCITENYIRIPKRLLWIPSTHEFAGVLIENDLKGRGLSTIMNVPESMDDWKNQDGIYFKDNMILVPADKYALGEHNSDSYVKDGLAASVFTEEGAEIFARTANDNNKMVYNLGIDITRIVSPEQRVAVLDSGRVRLYLGCAFLDDVRGCFSFGVRPQNFSSGNK